MHPIPNVSLEECGVYYNKTLWQIDCKYQNVADIYKQYYVEL